MAPNRASGATVAKMGVELLRRLGPHLRQFMGGVLNKVFLVDLFQGLWVTFRNQNPRYIYTEQYPSERPKVAERYRARPGSISIRTPVKLSASPAIFARWPVRKT